MLTFLASRPQLGVAIFVAVVLSGVFAFVQEERAERAAERLRDLLPHQVTVVRGGGSVQVAADVLAGNGLSPQDIDLVVADPQDASFLDALSVQHRRGPRPGRLGREPDSGSHDRAGRRPWRRQGDSAASPALR